MITVVGMGTKRGDLTLDGLSAIKSADVVVVKSALTHMAKTVEEIRTDVIYCDDVYESAENFDELNSRIEQRLCAQKGNVVFCVVGEGSDDSTVQAMTCPFKVIAGVGIESQAFVGAVSEGVRIFNAQSFVLESDVIAVPTAVKCIDDKYLASEVQLNLTKAFDSDTPAVYFDGKKAKVITIADLTKQKFCYMSCLYVCPKPFTSRSTFGYYDAVKVMRILRAPNGCPWDREQTHESITNNAIEEAYELVHAIQTKNVENMIEELGDMLMQVLFHQEIAHDDGEFEEPDVATALCRKLIERHPHVFGDVVARDAEESLKNWNAVKQKQHAIKNTAENLLDVPRGMSGLIRTEKIQGRASKGGYEFENITQCAEKVTEELGEFLAEYNAGSDKIKMEAGDLLFAVVNVLRMAHVEPETALLLSTDKFVGRVCRCEKILAERGQNLKELSMAEFDEIWAEAKKYEQN